MTIAELHEQLTPLWPNYELAVHWRFVKTGNEYEVKWRPEGNMGLLSEYPVEVTGKVLSRVLEEVLHKATEFKAQIEAVQSRDFDEAVAEGSRRGPYGK